MKSSRSSRFNLILLGAGKGERYHGSGRGLSKAFIPMDGDPLCVHALRPFLLQGELHHIIFVCQKKDHAHAREVFKRYGYLSRVTLVTGGSERFLSVYAGLRHCALQVPYVLIHDAARPLLHQSDLRRLLDLLFQHATGGVIPSHRVIPTIKQVSKEGDLESLVHLKRQDLREVSTPQGFPTKGLLAAYENHPQEGAIPTDDAEVFMDYQKKTSATMKEPIRLCPFEHPNPKLTFAHDLPAITYLYGKRHSKQAPPAESLGSCKRP